MKIGIIGGSDGLGALIAAELAKRYVPAEVEVVVVQTAQDIATDEHYSLFDVLFDTRPEPIVHPIVLRELTPWPDDYTHTPSRSRYNRTPKWKRNKSGSKYF